MRSLLVLIGVLGGGCVQANHSSTVDPSLARAKAVECHLEPDQLKIAATADSRTEVHVGPSPTGQLPDFQALRCFIEWAQTQKGIRVGFISEPPPESQK